VQPGAPQGEERPSPPPPEASAPEPSRGGEH
jgi:hypothetical protein